MSLAQALASRAPDSDALVVAGTVTAFAADGTCSVDLGGGRVTANVLRPDSVSLSIGDAVVLTRRDSQGWIVLYRPAAAAPAAVPASAAWTLPWNVGPAPSVAANPLVVSPYTSGSWRAMDGWSGDNGGKVYQGYYGSSSYQRYGAWFYGSGAFGSINGQTCTSCTLRVHRDSSGGVFAAEYLHVRLHRNPTKPGGSPSWHSTGPVTILGPAVGGTSTISLPTWMGQTLMNGTAAGVGLYYGGQADYDILVSHSTDSANGQLTIGWS